MRMVRSRASREFFVDCLLDCPLLCTRKLPGTRTIRFHDFGGTPPVAKIPRAGRSSGAQPWAGRKNASGVKLRAASLETGRWYSTERRKLCREETVQGCGNVRRTLRGLSGEAAKLSVVLSQWTPGPEK